MRKTRLKALIMWLLAALPPLASGADYDGLAHSQWIEARSEHFALLTDASPDKARYIVQDLENYRQFIRQKLNLSVIDGLPPLPILAVEKSANFSKFGLPGQFGGVFISNIHSHAAIADADHYKPSAGSSSLGRHILLHEYFHYLLQKSTESIVFPAWFDEGMAEYWATFKYTDERVSIGHPGAINFRAFGLEFRKGKFGPLYIEELFNAKRLIVGMDNMNEQRKNAKLYSRAFYTVHYLNSTPELERSMYHYIGLTSQGISTDNAFQQAFGKSYSRFDRDVQSYLNQSGKLIVRNFPLKKGAFPTVKITTRELSEADFYRYLAEIVWPLNLESAPADERIALLDKAIKLNPDYPSLRVHRHRLAEHRIRWSDLASKLLKSYPDSAHVHTLLGEGLTYEAELRRTAGVGDAKARLESARGHFRISAQLDPQYGASYAGLGRVYDHLDQNEPVHEGIIGYDSASVYQRDPSFFVGQAQLAIKMGQPLGAIAPLRKFFSYEKHEDFPQLHANLESLELYNLTGQIAPEKKGKRWLYPDGSHYTGDMENQIPHGKGKLVTPNGSVFEGQFVKGGIDGPGRLTTRTGTSIKGRFHQGLVRDRIKLHSSSEEGDYRYEGEFKHGRQHGRGKEHYTDGDYYDGTFFEGRRHGTGRLTLGQSELVGEWRRGGYVWNLEDGLTFVGWFTEDGAQPDGEGVCFHGEKEEPFPCEFNEGTRVN